MGPRLSLQVLIALSVCIVLAQQPPKPAGEPVECTRVVAQRVGDPLTLPGSLLAVRKGTVAAPVAGLVSKLLVRDGDVVEPGDLLAELDHGELDLRRESLMAQIQESAARRKAAASRERRAGELYDSKVVSAEQWDEVRYDLEALEARLKGLRAELALVGLDIARSSVHAPYCGVVTKKMTEVGQWLKVGEPIVALVCLKELEVLVQVPETYVSQVRVGQAATVRFEASKARSLRGRVSVIIPEAAAEARTFPVKVAVPNEIDGANPGMLARVELGAARLRGATLVPKDALVNLGSRMVVFVVREDKQVSAQTVVLGAGHGQWQEVVGEIRAGQLVVTKGNERLRDGQVVVPRITEYPTP